MSNSKIEWTEATWNPLAGCAVLTPGCTNCYAMKMAARLEAMGQELYAGLTKPSKAGPVWTGVMRQASESVLLAPLRRKKPTTYFVNSMSDLFHEGVPDEAIDKVFAVMALCPQHTFQVLTKRAERMRSYLSREDLPNRLAWEVTAQLMNAWHPDWKSEEINGAHRSRAIAAFSHWPLENVWLGVSTERQKEADERIPLLLQTPATVRFISAEPLLGPLDVRPYLTGREDNGIAQTVGACTGWTPPLDWVITGGESGHDARPSHPDWFRQIRDACAAAGVAYFHKQNGEWAPGECADGPPTRTEDGATWFNDKWLFERLTPRVSQETHHDDAPDVYRLGKKAAGRLLDGKTWDQMPGGPSA